MPRSEQPTPWHMAHIGLELAGAVIVLALVGYWVDRQLGTGPWGVLVGTGLGFVGGMYLFIKQAVKATGQYYPKTDPKNKPPAAKRNDKDTHRDKPS